MIEKISKFGKMKLFRSLFYPITSLILNPIILVISLFNSLDIFIKGPKRFPHFDIRSGMNSFFYSNRSINLDWFGRSGVTPFLGLKNFNLARCFQYDLTTLRWYKNAGALVLLLSMFIWLFGHGFWLLENISSLWLFLCLALMIFSSQFYTNLFRYQNYNVIGWTVFPIMLYALFQQNIWLLGISILLISFGSFSVFIITSILLTGLATITLNFSFLIALIPGGIKILLHFLPLFKSKEGGEIIKNVAKAIGVTSKDVKYKRKNGKKLTFRKLYFIGLFVQFYFVYLFNTESIQLINILLVGSGLIAIINFRFLRFADDQTIFMLWLSVSAFALINSPFSLTLMISFWLLNSPLPILNGYDHIDNVIDILPTSKPFDISDVQNEVEDFLSPVSEGDTVFMAFENPNGVYENVFDGMRYLIELPCYICTLKKVKFIPEWWGVFQINSNDSEDIWGRDLHSIQKNMKLWDAKYLIFYSDKELSFENWENHFDIVSQSNWKSLKTISGRQKKLNLNKSIWYLLQIK